MGDALVCAHFPDLARGFGVTRFFVTLHVIYEIVKLGVSLRHEGVTVFFFFFFLWDVLGVP